jgi:hypothetical protein
MRLGTPCRRSGLSLCRAAVVLLSLAGYLTAVVGFPSPGGARKVSQQPFPCQHHACGCVDAEQCWRGCCCFTPAQKLAWAEAHHVTPPADAEREPAESQLAAEGDEHSHKPQIACEAHSNDCDHATSDHECGSAAAAGCAAGHSAEHCCSTTGRVVASEGSESAVGVRFVSGDAWRKCRGLATLWVSSGAAALPPAAATWQFSWDVVEWLATPASNLCGGCRLPPIPPPRV